MKKYKPHFNLFGTGFAQVFFVVINNYQVAHEKYIGCLLVGFVISWIWSYNVKKVAFGSKMDRIIYASGAGVGSMMGLVISKNFYELFEKLFIF